MKLINEAAFRELYRQFMFFSDNGLEIIENPAFAVSEACKCCGQPRDEVRKALSAFEEYGLVKKIDQERLQYTMTESGSNQSYVEALLKRLAAE